MVPTDGSTVNAGRARALNAPKHLLARLVGAIVAVALIGAVLTLPVTGAVFSDVTDNSSNTMDADALDAPTSFLATSGVTISLDWTATVDAYATGYRILRSTAPGGPYTQIAEIADPAVVNFVDAPPEGTYYYVSLTYFESWESALTAETTGRAWRPFDCPIDPDLRACIRFDTDLGGTYADESGYLNTVTHTNSSQVDGISGQAARGTPAARYWMADSASLDLTAAVTMEMWARFDSVPTTGRVGLIDNDGQYSVIYFAGIGLRCSNGVNDLPHVAIPVGVWFHVACTWDGAVVTMYIDGLPVVSQASVGTPGTTNTDPVSLLNTSPVFDEPLDGAMDNLRIWHAGRTQAQICADAGLSC